MSTFDCRRMSQQAKYLGGAAPLHPPTATLLVVLVSLLITAGVTSFFKHSAANSRVNMSVQTLHRNSSPSVPFYQLQIFKRLLFSFLFSLVNILVIYSSTRGISNNNNRQFFVLGHFKERSFTSSSTTTEVH